jgi:hypothetical protein
MINKPEMGVILQPLEKRFRALTTGQTEVYHERLKYFERPVLEAVVNTLVDHAKAFPSPGEIKEKCGQVSKKRPELVKYKTKGCVHCYDGYVFYEALRQDRNAIYVGDCAYCHRDEISIQAQVIQRDNRIYYACEKVGDQGRYRANPDIQELYREAEPVKTDDELKARFNND